VVVGWAVVAGSAATDGGVAIEDLRTGGGGGAGTRVGDGAATRVDGGVMRWADRGWGGGGGSESGCGEVVGGGSGVGVVVVPVEVPIPPPSPAAADAAKPAVAKSNARTIGAPNWRNRAPDEDPEMLIVLPQFRSGRPNRS
jgi:hypothetical protein